jgi:precorrin-8X/cobalt-precorrin-8 methylmutase
MTPAPEPGADVGRAILAESFARIERELGPHTFPPWAFAVVRRMIHASADFDFADTLRYSADFPATVAAAVRARVPVITDTEMVLLGIRTAVAGVPGLHAACYLNDPEAADLAAAARLTRAAAGVRLAGRRHAAPLLVIGNAPTAVEEVLRLTDAEGWRPAAVVAVPVGFVGVVEAKQRLLTQATVPYLTCVGRKGGSAVTAAALNALLDFFGEHKT